MGGDELLNNLFCNCSTSQLPASTGGGIQMWAMAIPPKIKNCPDGTGGCDILLQDQQINIIDSSCYSSRIIGQRVGKKYNSLIDTSTWLRNDGGRIRFVSSALTKPNAKDTYACGINESHPCGTISHCLTQLIPDVVKDVQILTGTITETKSVDCGTNSFTIYGQSGLSTTVQTELEAAGLSLFAVSTGTLSVSDFALLHSSAHPNNRGSWLFEINGAGVMSISSLNVSIGSGQSTETAFTTELINVQNGVLQMDNVNWAKTISTTSLFSLSSTNEISLTLSECAFDGIERTNSEAAVLTFSNDKANMNLDSCSFSGCGSTGSENGGSMMLCVGDANEVNVKDGSFNGCYCSVTNGLGGGILLQLLNANPNFKISSSFGTNTAKWGRDIFVLSPDLEETARSQKIQCVAASLDSFDKVRGYDNGNNTVAIPLCIYLLPTPEEIYVSNTEASDHSHCGIVQFPCLTIKHSLTRQTETKKVTASGMIMMADELAFANQKHEIRGNDDESGWTVSDSSATSNSAMLTTSVETVLSKLIFSLPSSFSSHSTFISSSSSTLTLSHCSLTLQDSSSELVSLFLSIASGILTIDSFSASSITLSGNPLISLSGSITKAELKSVQLNAIGTSFTSGLFEVKNNASLQVCDSVVSSIARSEELASSRLISTTDANKIVIIRSDISNFAVNNQNGGAIECTLESGCSFVFEEGTMSSCKSEGGNGGGLWVRAKSGSSLRIGNVTEAPSNNENENENENEQEEKVCFSHCEASANVDGGKGFGGGACLYLDAGASDFVLKSVRFDGCSGRKGKDLFLDANDLRAVTNTATIGFNVDVNELHKLNGFERSTANEEFVIPLVVYFWNNFTSPCHVGGQKAHDFSGCGFEQVPCCTITQAADLRFSGKNKSIKLHSPFSFVEELIMDIDEWNVTGEGNISSYEIAADISGAQKEYLRYTAQPPLLSCLDVSFVKAERGKIAISNTFGNGIRWQTSAIIANGRNGGVPSVEIAESRFSGSGEQSGCLMECRSIKSLNITKCEMKTIERVTGNGGCIYIDISNDNGEGERVDVTECVFDRCSVLADESRGGAMFSQLKGNIQMNVISCTFIGCTAPTEEEKSGFGGGMALKLIDDYSLFVISSPVFDSDKPNVARYGNDLFVESPSLTKSITNASLPFVCKNLNDISLDSMRGFDGNDTTNAIPLVYFWIALGSEIFVGGEGKDMGACGFSDCPCLSIDYSLDRLSEGNERDINIIGKGVLQKCVDVSGAAIKSDNSLICSLECLASLEGSEKAAMKIQGITNFELINFVMPSSFTGDVKSLMHVGSCDALLTVKDCSFTKMEESEEEIISYGLIKADGGTVQLELVTMQSLSFSKDVISVLSSTMLNIKNLTMKNVDLDGSSGLSISKGSKRGKNEDEQNIVVEWSVFEEVTQNTTDDNPVIRNDNDDEPLKMVIRNTTMKKCGGTRCGKGGAMFALLNEGGHLDCLFCTISECFCSTTGRGGWLFLECTSTAEQPLKFVLSNITFRDNAAFRGRDVYARCRSIENQIADEQFLLDFRAPFVKDLAMWGCTTDSFVGEEDLLLRVVKYQSETIFVSSAADNHEDSKQCGEFGKPCESLNEGVQHIVPSQYSQLLVSHQTAICSPCSATSVSIRSLESPSSALVHLDTPIQHCPAILATSANVRIECLDFLFSPLFSHTGSAVVCHTDGHLSLSFVQFASSATSSATSPAAHPVLLNSSLLAIEGGHLTVDNCSVLHLAFALPPFLLSTANRVALANISLQHLQLSASAFEFRQCQSASAHSVAAEHLVFSQGSILCLPATATGDIAFSGSSFRNCTNTRSSSSTSTSTSTSFGSSVLSASSPSAHMSLSNFTCSQCGPSPGNDADEPAQQGSVVSVSNAADLSLAMCVFEGAPSETTESANENENGNRNGNRNRNSADSICSWNASLVHLCNTTAAISDLTVANASDGALSVSGGTVRMDDAKFVGNSPSARSSPSASSYPSARRNIACSDGASLTLASVKGGDGAKDNTSLWILDSGCTLAGIPRHRLSPFFIPTLHSAHEAGNEADEQSEVTIRFQGELLLPCNLSFLLATTIGTEELLHRYEFDAKGLVSEKEAFGEIQGSILREAPAEAEVSVCLLFGNADAPSATEPFILKNKSDGKANGDERIVEGGKEGKSYWLLIVIACSVFIMLLAIIVVLAVRWRKQKRRTEELEVIVNDNIRKDPKAFEMVTMEMSPEEQWRRAEREAEKKNEERIKKRAYDTNMQHSESSEHLLSESGSTEYILGRDSDKIPEWALEKDEEEETRKRSPSPSISSTSTTDTSDTESTFVRGGRFVPNHFVNVESGGCDELLFSA
ncbi:uncharacterized protein MONOS_17641 [Monocercomonoides exilis]|uniref:uncharacterized protein n=1 Tax=Monocercomonoides exilis TaxID=2049356 RepID=UPI003559463D|nr:hypothetical protein MONOS_17641 [Monocercomonoides exilis]